MQIEDNNSYVFMLKNLMKIFLMWLLWSGIYLSSFATIINVPSDYTTIQSALNNCSNDDTVLVQPGTYFENVIWPDIAGIKLFAVGDSTNTVIDGNKLGRVLTFFEVNTDTSTIVRGFKITNGYLEGENVTGAGIYLYECEAKFEEMCITGNHLFSGLEANGAGIKCEESNSVFRNSSISFNYIDSAFSAAGAGISVSNGEYLRFDNLEILNNRIESHGYASAFIVISTGALNILINSCRIMNNSIAISKGAGTMTLIGAYVSITNTAVDSNETGGGSEAYGGGGIYLVDCQITMVNCRISSNITGDSAIAYLGGGIYFGQCIATLTNVEVSNNKSGNGAIWYKGAGIYSTESNLLLQNVLVVNNLMGFDGNSYTGGGIYFSDGFYDPLSIDLINVTVANNQRLDSGEIFGSGIYIGSNIYLSSINSIFWNPNYLPEIDFSNYTPDFDYCNIRYGFSGTANIDADPSFVSSTDFHLLPTSPCIGVGKADGAPTFDLEGSYRPLPVGTNPDLGCYEMDIAVSGNFNQINSQILIYPNPATTHFEMVGLFSYPELQGGFIYVTNLYGHKVLSFPIEGTAQTSIDISALHSGLYFCTIWDGSGRIVNSLKVIKQ